VKQFSLLETAWWRQGREIVSKFSEDNCVLIAAAISFFTLLSLIPLMLLGVGVLGSVLSLDQARNVVIDFVQEQLPGVEGQITDQLDRLIRSHHWSGAIGVVGLIWAAAQVFLNLEVALNLAWHAHARRNHFHRRALALAMTLLTGLPLILSLFLTAGITALRSLTLPVLEWSLDSIPLFWMLVGELVPVLLTVAAFTAIYRWVPNRFVSWRAALTGGIWGGLLWELAKRVFAYYAASLGHFGGIYGPFAGIIGLMLWTYYSALILLIGAEIGAVTQSVHPIAPAPGAVEAEERLREAATEQVNR
jgi:membrane protein